MQIKYTDLSPTLQWAIAFGIALGIVSLTFTLYFVIKLG